MRMRPRDMFLRALVCSAALLMVLMAMDSLMAQEERDFVEGRRIEEYGAVGDYTGFTFYNNLTVIPAGGEGDGTSRVVYTGDDNVIFDENWVGGQLVLFRCHHNPAEFPATRNYYPNIVTSRYVNVTGVIDARTLEVDLSINGGNRNFQPDGTTPSVVNGSGYFFTNNREAFNRAFTDPDRPETILLENGKSYAVRGGWNASVSKNLVVTTPDPDGPRAAIKLSFEDSFAHGPYGVAGTVGDSFVAEYGSSAFFILREGQDYSIRFENVDILPTHYVVPKTQYGDGLGTLFNDTGSWATQRAQRTLEVIGSDGLREADAIGEYDLPDGLAFALPGFASSNAGGIDGEVDYGGEIGLRRDVVGFQEFRLIRSNWRAWQIHGVKQQGPVAGNCFIAEGESQERKARLVVATDVRLAGEPAGPNATKFRHPVTITDHEGDDQFRRVNLKTSAFTWYQLANQYWRGGVPMSHVALALEVDDPDDPAKTYRVYSGCTREFAREADFGISSPLWFTRGLVDGMTAEFFERIPKVGNSIAIGPQGEGMSIKVSDTVFRIFGWALQPGDALEHGGRRYEITGIDRQHRWGRDDAPARYGQGYGGEVDYGDLMYMDITLDAPVAEPAPTFTVASSRLEFLLNGEREVYIVNLHMQGNYFCYSDHNTNVRMKNVIIQGGNVFRATSRYGPADSNNLARQTKYLEFVNVHVEAPELYNQLVSNVSLGDRGRITGQPRRVLIDGGRFYWTNSLPTGSTEVELRNRPTLIHGTGSYGEPRLVNPLLDGKGFVLDAPGLSIQLTNGFECDLSNLFVTERASFFKVCGDGKLIVDGLEFEGDSGGISIGRATGFDHRIPNRLTIEGRNGQGGFSADAPLDPERTRVTLVDWTLLEIPGGRDFLGVRRSLNRGPIPAANITVNGEHPQ